MRRRFLFFLQAVFISIISVYGCSVYQKPRPFYDVPFQERSQSKVNGEVRVTVAVLRSPGVEPWQVLDYSVLTSQI